MVVCWCCLGGMALRVEGKLVEDMDRVSPNLYQRPDRSRVIVEGTQKLVGRGNYQNGDSPGKGVRGT